MQVPEWLVDAARPYQFRGKARLLGGLTPNSGMRTCRVFGFRLALDLSEHIQRMIFLGAYERWESRMVARFLKPGSCFVDVGANVGYFTLMASRAVGPQGRVFAVEPSPYAADRLAQTISDNGIGNVVLERVALGSEPGNATLYDPLPDNHTPTMLGEPGSGGRSVPVRRLDDCLDQWRAGPIDLLKIDVEGYEPAALEGASKALSEGCIHAILCEFNDHWLRRAGSSPASLRDFILGFGFEDATGSPWDAQTPLSNRLFVLERRPQRERDRPAATSPHSPSPPNPAGGA